MPEHTPGDIGYAAYVWVRYGLAAPMATTLYKRRLAADREAWDAAAEAAIAAWIASPDWPTPQEPHDHRG